MKLPPALSALLAATPIFFGALPCCGQVLVLKNGQTAPAKDLRREGDTLLTTIEVAGHSGQQGYAIADIEKLDIPKPAEISQAEQALVTGKAAEAVKLIDPVMVMYYPLRDVKGNFWAPAVLIKSSALQMLNRIQDATALLTLLSAAGSDHASSVVAKARLAGLLALQGKAKAADAVILADSIINTSEDHAVLAEAWLAKGHALMVEDNFEDAILAFLHLPVFYDENPSATAKADLGAGRSYLAIGDKKRAAQSFLQIEESFATLAEAAEAKAEVAKAGPEMEAMVKDLAHEEESARDQMKPVTNENPSS